MAADLGQGLNGRLLGSIVAAGGFGAPARCQLFVGADAAAHARTVLHFDQYDNIFMQLSGRKTFLLFDPLQTGCLGPYPIHHPLDRSARLDLEESLPAQRSRCPCASNAKGCVVTLEPGDVLVLPAYCTRASNGRPAALRCLARYPGRCPTSSPSIPGLLSDTRPLLCCLFSPPPRCLLASSSQGGTR